MRKENAKDGMAVSLKKEIFELMKHNGYSATEKNIFYVHGNGYEDNGAFVFTLSPASSESEFPQDCEDFEPFDEERDRAIESMKRLDKFFEEHKKKNAITQEYIETFGFELTDRLDEWFQYKKTTEKGMMLCLDVKDGYYSCFRTASAKPKVGWSWKNDTSIREKYVLFNDYKCTTREQLRFLLTNGRTDCTK